MVDSPSPDKRSAETVAGPQSGFARNLRIALVSVLLLALLISAGVYGWQWYESSQNNARDRRFYGELSALLTQIQKTRADGSRDFDAIQQTARRLGPKITSELKPTASSDFPARQALLWAARDEIPHLLMEDLSAVSDAEVAFAQQLANAAALLKLPPPALSSDGPDVAAALDTIIRLGAVITRDSRLAIQPVTSISMRGDQFRDEHLANLPNVTALEIESAEVTDAGINSLRRNRSLKNCSLRCDQLTDVGISILVDLPMLNEVHLYDCSVTDSGLSALRRVRRLVISSPKVTNRTLTILRDFPQLQHLSLASDELTGGFGVLASAPHLTSLTISHCHNLRDSALSEIATIHGLEAVALYGCPVTDAGLQSLCKVPRLTKLVITPCQKTMPDGLSITDEGLSRLGELKNLHVFSIQGCAGITDASLSVLEEMDSLRVLQLHETGITKQGSDQIAAALHDARVEFANPFSSRTSQSLEAAAAIRQITDRHSEVSRMDGEDVWMVSLNEHGPIEFSDSDLNLLKPIGHVRHLKLYGKSFTDKALGILADVNGLESLEFNNFAITQDALHSLAKLPKLRLLKLNGIAISHVGGPDFESLPLADLEIENCGLQDEGMIPIGLLPHLTHLGLREPQISADGLARLSAASKLTTLTLSNMPISNDAMKRLTEIPKLKMLSLENCKLDSDSLSHFADYHELFYLILSEESLNDEVLKHVKSIPRLQNLYLEKGTMTDAGLANVADCRILSILAIKNAPVTDGGLKSLTSLDHLKVLTLLRTGVTADGVADFKKTHSHTVVTNSLGKGE